MKKLLIGTVVTPFRIIKDGGILIEGNRVLSVGSAGDFRDEQAERMNFDENFLLPGFVDIHVHGGGGKDTMDGSTESLRTIVETHAKGGTTSLLPTTLTAPMEDIKKVIKVVSEMMKESEPIGSRILGVHLEGPYFSPEQAGAQNPEYLKNPSINEIKELVEIENGIVKRVSLAPELPGALEVMRYLRKEGILVSIAHSNASYSDVVKAVEAGASHVTHIYSGMSTVRRIRSYRISGVIESALLMDELTVEMIADGHHLPPSLMKLILKCKGLGNVCAITDAMPAAGLGPGRYSLGGLDVIVENDVPDEYEIKPPGFVAKLSNGQAFAGSSALMIDVFKVLVKITGLQIQDASKLMSYNPARFVGVDHERGSISAGKYADIVVVDEDLNLLMTMVEGKIVFEK